MTIVDMTDPILSALRTWDLYPLRFSRIQLSAMQAVGAALSGCEHAALKERSKRRLGQRRQIHRDAECIRPTRY